MGGPHVVVLAVAANDSSVGRMLLGVADRLAPSDGRLTVVRTHGAPGTGASRLGRRTAVPAPLTAPIGLDHADGVLVLPGAAHHDLLAALGDRGVPSVFVGPGAPVATAPLVLPPDEDATVVAVEHLVSHGHRRICFVGDLGEAEAADRWATVRRTVAMHGLTADLAVVDGPARTAADGAAAADRLLAMTPRPRAVLVCSDAAARGLMARVAQRGVDVPADVAVVAFGGEDASAFATPSLSTVGRQWEQVGHLAADLLLAALDGSPSRRGPHLPPPAALAARGSCGCRPDLLGEHHLAMRRSDTPLSEVREGLRSLLHRTLATAAVDADGAVSPTLRAALDDVDALLDGDTLGTAIGMRQVITHLHRLARRPEDLQHAADAITEYVERSVAELQAEPTALTAAAPHGGPPRRPKASRISGAVWQLQAAAYLRRLEAVEQSMREQLGVAFTLLDRTAGDPRSLAWLAGTPVRAAVLGLWAEPAEAADPTGPVTSTGTAAPSALDVVGCFDADGSIGAVTGSRLPVTAFPPPSLPGSAGPHEACFVVPVRDARGDWGLLALVGRIDLSSGREAFHHWAMLLCAAFEAEARDRAVEDGRQRQAIVAEATNDGLWEWHLARGELYLSPRARHLLAIGEDEEVTAADVTALAHPDDAPSVRAAVQRARTAVGTAVEAELRILAPDGATSWLHLRAIAVPGPGGEAERLVGGIADIGDRKRLEEDLRRGALVDPVTALANRRMFLERLRQAIADAGEAPQRPFAVLFLDLDGFKLVNDSLGHLAGDQLLVEVAHRLQACVRPGDVVARFGGDEFAVLLHDIGPESVGISAHRFQAAVAEPITLGGQEVAVTASIGVVTSAQGYRAEEDVLRDADLAMYDAKAAARGSVSFFAAPMHQRATVRLRAINDVREALHRGELSVRYQPVVAVADGLVTRLEALLRWEHPDRGWVPPAELLPAAVDARVSVDVGRFVLETVCADVARWRAGYAGPLQVAVNLSHEEFWHPQLTDLLADTLARHGITADHVALELTEQVVTTDLDGARAILTDLRRRGHAVHVDDFGTGQTSLHALRSLPVDLLKVDGSFVRDLGTSRESDELVRFIVDLARALGLQVVAEHVETEQQLQRLVDVGCADVQGWLYSADVPATAVPELLGSALTPVGRVRRAGGGGGGRRRR